MQIEVDQVLSEWHLHSMVLYTIVAVQPHALCLPLAPFKKADTIIRSHSSLAHESCECVAVQLL